LIECVSWPEGKGPTPYQLDSARLLVTNHRHTVRGPRGLGKTTLAALVILWFGLTRSLHKKDWKCVSTANYWRQLQKFLWPEIHKWILRLKWDKEIPRPSLHRDELLTLSFRLPYGEAFAVASSDPESMEGAHADQVLYVFDESKIIPHAVWNSVEGAFANAWGPDGREAFWLATSIPGTADGRYYDIHRGASGYEEWSTSHVTKGEVVDAGQMSEPWAEGRRQQWGEGSELYQNHVLGEFAETSTDSLIPLAWIEAAQGRWREREAEIKKENVVQFGVDVGRGGDKTVIASRTQSNAIVSLERNNVANTMYTAGLVTGKLNGATHARAMIDLPGIGAGVVDRVREDHPKRTEAFVPSGRTDFRDRSGEFGFPNKRCAALWNLREMLDPDNGENLCLPPDDTLAGDLTSFHFRYISGARIQVESKRTSFSEDEQTLVQRLGHSPDDGDAVVMAFWHDPVMRGIQTRVIMG